MSWAAEAARELDLGDTGRPAGTMLCAEGRGRGRGPLGVLDPASRACEPMVEAGTCKGEKEKPTERKVDDASLSRPSWLRFSLHCSGSGMF